MKNTLLVLLLITGIGCNSLKRLTDGGEPNTPQETKVLVGGGSAPYTGHPQFDVPTPEGTTRQDYVGDLPVNGTVQVAISPNSTVKVFLLEKNINQWFFLKPYFSDAFYYEFNASTGIVHFKGAHLQDKAYCVYQYTVSQ